MDEGQVARRGQIRGKVIAVGNLKGGVGKSTLTVNIAASFRAQGRRVCVVDCDAQATAGNWLVDGDLDVHVAAMPNDHARHTKLWFKQIRLMADEFDILIIDLPASMNHALASAMLVAHLVVIPLSPSAVDIHATERMIDALQAARQERSEQPPSALLVPTQVPTRLMGSSELQSRLQPFGLPIGPALRYDEAFQDAFQAYQWIGQSARAEGARQDVEMLRQSIEVSLLSAAIPPLLAAKPGLFGRATRSLPISDRAANHREGLTWWHRLLKSA